MRITRIRALFALCGAVVAVALILVVGTFWFGWYETARVRAVLDSLPVPPDAQFLSDYPHGIELDESFLTPYAARRLGHPEDLPPRRRRYQG